MKSCKRIYLSLARAAELLLYENIVSAKCNLAGLAHRCDRLGGPGVKGGVRELFVPEKVDKFGREGLIPEQFKIYIWAGNKLNTFPQKSVSTQFICTIARIRCYY